MALKTYKSKNNGQLFLTLRTGEKTTRVVFQASGQYYAESYYTTKDEEIQKALEAAPSFGKKYALYRVSGEIAEKKRPLKEPTSEAKVDASAALPEDGKRLLKAKSFQAAKEELQREFGDEMSAPNMKILKEKARERGITIEIE